MIGKRGKKFMRFRPCIDIHNGQEKQNVGGSLTDKNDFARENFVSEQDAAWYAKLYQEDGLKGGHVILLNGADSPYYEATKAQALKALKAYPGGRCPADRRRHPSGQRGGISGRRGQSGHRDLLCLQKWSDSV